MENKLTWMRAHDWDALWSYDSPHWFLVDEKEWRAVAKMLVEVKPRPLSMDVLKKFRDEVSALEWRNAWEGNFEDPSFKEWYRQWHEMRDRDQGFQMIVYENKPVANICRHCGRTF